MELTPHIIGDLRDCALRPIEEADLPRVLEWRNSNAVRDVSFTDHLITLAEHEAWYRGLKTRMDAACYVFTMKDVPLGVVNFTGITADRRSCTWGFYVGPKEAPRGTGTALGRAALEKAFGELKFEEVHGEVFSFNTASLRFHEKLGFKREPSRDRQVQKKGVAQTVLAFSLKKSDWS